MARHRTIDDVELLAVARRVFLERGHTASTHDVAQEAGISQGVLFQRFRTKDELFFAALMPTPPDVGVLLGSEPERDVERHLVGIALRVLEYFASVAPSILHLVTHPGFGHHAAAHAHEHLLALHLVRAIAERLESLSRRGLTGPTDAQATADAFVAALHSMAMFEVLSGNVDKIVDRKRAKRFVQVFWQGLAPR